jgi:hypothetical protein
MPFPVDPNFEREGLNNQILFYVFFFFFIREPTRFTSSILIEKATADLETPKQMLSRKKIQSSDPANNKIKEFSYWSNIIKNLSKTVWE